MSQPVTRLRVRGPDSLPAVIPHLVGFHPHSSLVILGLAGGVVRITVRVDLPEHDVDHSTVIDTWCTALAGLIQAEAEQAILAVYPAGPDNPWLEREPRPLPWADLVGELADEIVDLGIATTDIVCVVGDRVRSYLCANDRCCPPEGRMVAPDEALRLAAAFVEHGSAPLDSRECLADQLVSRAPDDPMRVEVNRITDRVFTRQPIDLLDRNNRFVADLARWGGNPRNPSAFTRLVATVRLLMVGIRSRDLLLHTLTTRDDRALLHAARAVLSEAVRCADEVEVAPLASVLALCSWVGGDGASAWVALDRAVAADPDYSLADLVATALERGLPPWSWTQMMSGLSVAEILGDAPPGPERPPV